MIAIKSLKHHLNKTRSLAILCRQKPYFINQIRLDSTSSGTDAYTQVNNILTDSNVSNKISFIADSPPTRVFEDVLCSIHDVLMVDWSTSIFIAALSFRLLVCFPIKIYQDQLVAKLINVQPIIDDIIKKRTKMPSYINMENLKSNMINSKKIEMLLRNQVYKHEGCLPQKIPISSFLQLPFWMYLTGAIRSLTFGIHDHPIEMQEIKSEAFLWGSSLAECDPYYILPIIYALCALSNIKYASLSSVKNTNVNMVMSFRKYLTLTFICVITLLITKMPMSVALFWIFSNSLSLAELILLDSTRIRRLFRIPKTHLDKENIHKYKLDLLKKQIQKLTNKKL